VLLIMPSTSTPIHVIDDDEAVRDSLAFLLRAAEMEVKTYASAKAFLDEFPGSAFGCVITDVRMPDMNGIDLLRHLKTLNTDLPVIVITGHGEITIAVEAMRLIS
jgi:two-component system, LuxR family, response regulator FixJ